jgi:hypothetical protein
LRFEASGAKKVRRPYLKEQARGDGTCLSIFGSRSRRRPAWENLKNK